tara:strand:+ start:121 stop:504 length:384 start_codon:yes stop_codon:yes gene_type:complete
MSALPTRIFTLAALYIVTGAIGLEIATLPSYATLIWPPSGIAIGMLLVYGWRLWPGIFIGAFLLNAYMSASLLSNGDMDVIKIISASFAALGSTMQALAGWHLVKRFFTSSLTLNSIKDFGELFALV